MGSRVRGVLAVLIVATLACRSGGTAAFGQPPAGGRGPAAGLSADRVEAFNDTKVQALRDDKGVVRQLRHMQAPFSAADANLAGPGVTPRSLADAYVRKVAPLLSLKGEEVDELSGGPENRLVGRGNEIRFSHEKTLGNAHILSYVQTHSGLPVWQAGLSVTEIARPLRVTSATSSVHPEVVVEKPGPDAKFLSREVSAEALGQALGLGAGVQGPALRVNGSRLLIYQYDPKQRVDPEVAAGQGKAGLQGPPPTLPLPPVPDSIRPGRHYVVNEVLFTLPVPLDGLINWRSLIDAQTGAVLYLRAGVAHATGMVYRADPITMTGLATDLPTAAVGVLDGLRTRVTIEGLMPPNGHPRDPSQSLEGEFVRLVDVDPPASPPPNRQAPFEFSNSVPTDDFAAVNAYHHTDSLFRLIQGMGIDVKQYFQGTTFPVPVDHRAMSNQVNAQAPTNATFTGSDGFRFGLAAHGTTVTIAADWRVVLHEFSHALLETSVHSPNFGFAHSAGDSLAAILNAPDSKAADPFLTFPWVRLDRRHDRKVADGWGWGGANDGGGYDSEQILSTTMFRIYRATGGDSNCPETRRLAARYVANLIVRGIGLLGTDPITPSPTADIFETALMNADVSTPAVEGVPGGAIYKVIRWGFETQGLHRAPGAATDTEGAPPAVDVYIDDGRHGAYLPYPDAPGDSPDVWNRTSADNGTVHQPPDPKARNFAYVRVKNRGTEAAQGVKVRVYRSRPGVGRSWPADWQAVTTVVRPAGDDPEIGVPAGGEVVVGPFEWAPGDSPVTLLASVSAAAPNDDLRTDLSNIDPDAQIPCKAGPIPIHRLVPFDNNLALRHIAPAADSLDAATKTGRHLYFLVRHAEKVDESDDPPLSGDGQERARALAALLKDAGVTAIFTSDRRRAIETARPLACALNLPVQSVAMDDPKALVGQLPVGRVLIVGHSNTVPDLLTALGVTDAVENPLQGYDNLFVVVRDKAEPPTLLRLRY